MAELIREIRVIDSEWKVGWGETEGAMIAISKLLAANKICEICGGAGLTWEDGACYCEPCVRTRIANGL